MSEMQFAFGYFEKSELDITPQDDDVFYELEEKMKCRFVNVDGQLYSFVLVGEYDPYGFSFVIKPSENNHFCAYWYNGGASVREVVESLIRNFVAGESK